MKRPLPQAVLQIGKFKVDSPVATGDRRAGSGLPRRCAICDRPLNDRHHCEFFYE